MSKVLDNRLYRAIVPLLWSGLLVLTQFLSFQTASASQGFYVVNKLSRPGMIMSLSKNPGVVESASIDNADTMVGILTGSEPEIGIEPGQVNIQTDGVSNVLVSTINGDIKVSDKIGASLVVGLGAKLNGNGWIVGIAQGSLDAHTAGAVKSVVSDTAGSQHDVYVASIPVLVKIVYYNNQSSNETSKSVIPEKLQSTVDSLAGKHASQIAVILAFILLFAGFIIAGIIVYSAAREAIRATGRQPLAKQPLMRRMMQSCAVALLILIAAVASASIVIRIL